MVGELISENFRVVATIRANLKGDFPTRASELTCLTMAETAIRLLGVTTILFEIWEGEISTVVAITTTLVITVGTETVVVFRVVTERTQLKDKKRAITHPIIGLTMITKLATKQPTTIVIKRTTMIQIGIQIGILAEDLPAITNQGAKRCLGHTVILRTMIAITDELAATLAGVTLPILSEGDSENFTNSTTYFPGLCEGV